MQEDGIPTNSYTFVSLFKACGVLEDLNQGLLFHGDAIVLGFVLGEFICNSLISMYGRCGAILDAEHIFRGSSKDDIVSWNAMLSAYTDNEQPGKALQLYVQLQDAGVQPDRPTYVMVLKACGLLVRESGPPNGTDKQARKTALEFGLAVHADIQKNNFGLNIYVSCTLIRFYGKCGVLKEAEAVFIALNHHDLVSCSALLSVYVEHGLGERSLQLYRQMVEEGISTDLFADTLVIQSCDLLLQNQALINLQLQCIILGIGQALHANARHKKGFSSSTSFHASVMNLYGKCGAMGEAFNAFFVVEYQDVTSWNAILNANIEYGDVPMGLHLFTQMLQEGIIPNQLTFITLFQACALLPGSEKLFLEENHFTKADALSLGEALHYDAACWRYTDNLFICNSILNMYVNCMALAKAVDFFCALPQMNAASWTTMIAGYVEQQEGVFAIRLYRQMLEEASDCCDELAFAIALQACICLAEKSSNPIGSGPPNMEAILEVGQSLYADAYRRGFSSSATLLGAVACMYSKCGMISKAESMFSYLMLSPNAPWSKVLLIYIEHGKAKEALLWYLQMHVEGKHADRIALTHAVQACEILAEKYDTLSLCTLQNRMIALEIGQALHTDAFKAGFMLDVFVSSSIISLYGKCGSIIEAEVAFQEFLQKDIVSWNAMLSAYVQQHLGERVVSFYHMMVRKDVGADEVTFLSALQGVSMIGCLDSCKQVHFAIVCTGSDQVMSIVSSLVHAYGSCASMFDAEDLFSKVVKPDVALWNTCSAGHFKDGNSVLTMSLFEELRQMHMRPSEVSFLLAISACSHMGLLMQGLEIFVSMRKDYHCDPGIKHYGSLFDLVGRSGDFKRLQDLLSRIPNNNLTIWSCLLAACFTHSNPELALETFNRAMISYHKDATPYVLFSNVCAHTDL
ncbi:hypothetical protein KP509_36G034200 [Ceratopteris richardii]|nr:hypothetical protein KP509_36G034200 [Ceratopteris richardii]